MVDQIFNVINYVVYTLFTIICIFPFYYLFINTISDNDLVVKGLINFIPRGIHFGNYAALLNVSDLMSSFIVSVTRTVFGTALMVAASAFIGYLVTQQEMWGRKVWYRFIVITMYFNAGLIPWFLNMQMLGLTNTYWAYILPSVQSALGLYLMMNFMGQIPEAMLEAARIDGAGELRIFWQIAMPNVKPAWLTVMIFSFQTIWNTTGATQMSQLVYDEKIKMVSSLLSQVVAGGTARAGAGSALSLLLMLPPIILFIASQSRIIETMSSSGMK